MQLLGNEKGDIKGLLIEWEELRTAANSALSLLMIQTLEINQQLTEGKCHAAQPAREQGENRTSKRLGGIGRLLINKGIYRA